MAIIAAVVGGVLVLGAVFFLIGRATSSAPDAAAPLQQGQVVEQSADIVEPIPDAPEPIVVPIPEDPGVEPTQPAEQPTQPAEQPTQPASGNTIEVGGGISASVPAGWSAKVLNDSQVYLGADGAGTLLTVYTVPAGATGSELSAYYVREVLSKEMTDLETSTPELLAVDVPSITSAAVSAYRGVYVTQQGSTPLEGIIYSFVRADGVAIVVDAFYTPGTDINAQLSEILISVLQNI